MLPSFFYQKAAANLINYRSHFFLSDGDQTTKKSHTLNYIIFGAEN
jgi:hypothetical protein